MDNSLVKRRILFSGFFSCRSMFQHCYLSVGGRQTGFRNLESVEGASSISLIGSRSNTKKYFRCESILTAVHFFEIQFYGSVTNAFHLGTILH